MLQRVMIKQRLVVPGVKLRLDRRHPRKLACLSHSISPRRPQSLSHHSILCLSQYNHHNSNSPNNHHNNENSNSRSNRARPFLSRSYLPTSSKANQKSRHTPIPPSSLRQSGRRQIGKPPYSIYICGYPTSIPSSETQHMHRY